MARARISGFEHGDTLEFSATGGTASVSTTYVCRSGLYSWRCNPTTTAVGWGRMRGINATTGAKGDFLLPTIYAKFNFMYVTKPAANEEQFFRVKYAAGATMKAELRLTSSGTIKLFDSTSTQVGSTGSTALEQYRWYRIEVQITTGGGTTASEVRIDGATEISGNGTYTANNTSDVVFGKETNLNGQSVDFYYDDFVADDSTWPGEGYIAAVPVTGDGSSSQWTGTYTSVDDTPPNDGDTTYIWDSTASGGHVSLFTIGNPGAYGVNGTIKSICAFSVCKEYFDHTSALITRIRSAGTNSDSGARNTTSSYTGASAIGMNLLEADPVGGAAFTYDRLKALEIGVVTNGTSSNEVRCTIVGLWVEYAPAPTPGVIISRERFGSAERIELRWTSDANGSAWSDWFGAEGIFDRAITVPNPTNIPTDNYDVTIENDTGLDVALGLLANRDTANTECVWIYKQSTTGDAERNQLLSRYRAKIVNAGANKMGILAMVIT